MMDIPVTKSGIILLPLLIMAGLVIGFIFAPRKGKVVLGVLLAVVAVLALTGFFWLKTRSVQRYDMEARLRQQHSYQEQQRLSQPPEMAPAFPAVWSEAIERQFPADSYPTLGEAAAGLTATLSERLKEWIGGVEPLPAVRIVAAAPAVGPGNLLLQSGHGSASMAGLNQTVTVNGEVLERVARELRVLYPQIQCRLVPSGDDAGHGELAENELMLEVTIDRLNLVRPTPPALLGGYGVAVEGPTPPGISVEAMVAAREPDGLPYPEFDGRLQVKLTGPHGTDSRSAVFYNKLWIENPGAVINQAPSAAWHVAYSHAPADSSDLARQQAWQQAVRWATPMNLLVAGDDRGDALASDEARLREWGIVADFYTQQLQGSAGPIWRAAVLLRVEPEHINWANVWVQDRQTAQRTHLARNALHLGGLILIIFGLYIFLNYATRGYYSLALKLLAGVVLAGAVVLILFVA